MNLHNCRLTLLVFLIYSLCACSEDKIGGEAFEGSCGITLKLATDHVVDLPLTKAGNEVTNQDLQVRIENTRAEVLKEWNYSDLPQLIRVNPGSYKMVAWHGTDSLYPLFDTPYYYGEIKLKMKDGDNIDTTMTCVSKAVQISVNFDESFDFDYSEYSVDIKTDGDSLNFAQNETRTGYFKPGKLRLRFVLKPKGQEQYYEFYPPAVATAKEREWYKMTLKANSNNGALESITITTDTTTIDIPVTEELSPIFLPKKAPKILTQGFVTGDTIKVEEGANAQSILTVQASGGLTSLVLKTTSDSLAAKGWPQEIDLMSATAENKQLLQELGLLWSSELNTETEIKKMVFIDFTNVWSKMNAPIGSTTKGHFEIIATDKYQQVSSPFDFNANIKPIFRFAGNEPNEGGIWAKKMYLELEYAANRTSYSPTFEVKGADGVWREITQIEVTPTGAIGFVDALTANSEYTIRGHIADIYTDEFIVRTEAQNQIPNSDMESYWNEEVWKKTIPFSGGESIHAFYPWASGATETWWNTRNRLTTDAPSGTFASWYYVACPGVVPCGNTTWSAVNHLNKFRKAGLPTAHYNGANSMEITTVGWGGNNWTSESQAQGDCKNRTAGALFVGDFDAASNVETYGKPFTTRPESVTFFYKYYPYQLEQTKAYTEVWDAQGESIGYGEYVIADTVKTYTNGVIPITYNTTMKKAAKITVVFLSTTAESPKTEAIKGNKGAIGAGYGDSRHIGSILTVDDIELVY
ncbi:MAG: DUF4493 domain-containing protein [Marinifilaceae bacterium]